MSTLANDIPVSTIGDRPCAVYRLYGAADALLYVGASNTPSTRIAKHATDKEWGDLIRHATVTWHAGRRAGLKAESEAIRTENPRYNVYRYAGPPRLRPSRNPANPLHHAPEAVTRAREAAGLTKTALAEKLGISLPLMVQIESGKSNATPAMLIKLAAALKCPRVHLENPRKYNNAA